MLCRVHAGTGILTISLETPVPEELLVYLSQPSSPSPMYTFSVAISEITRCWPTDTAFGFALQQKISS